MGLPAKLKNYNLFANGDSWQGLVSEIQLPKIAVKAESFRHAGMLAELDADMGLEKLEMEIKLGGFVVGALRLFGALGVAGTQLRFVGAYQEDATGGYLAAELVTRGKVMELDPGSAKVGDNTELSLKSTLSYLKWTVASRVEVEIDVINNIYSVDGVDRTAQLRAILQQ